MFDLMIVDDEPASRKVIRAFLDAGELGIGRVCEACNGQEALELLRGGETPQIVITDMEMPLVNGITLLGYLADCHPEIKVIVVSGYVDFSYTHAAITAGALDYILKPIDPAKLRAAVAGCVRALRQEREQEAVTVEGELALDTATYKAILREAGQIRALLEGEGFESVEKRLAELPRLFRDSPYPRAAEEFAARLLTNTLHYYCASYDTGLLSGEDATLQLRSSQTFASLRELYRGVLGRIREEKGKLSFDAVLERIRNYIDANYRLPLRLEGIAAAFFVNKEYMSTMFHRKYGVTLSGYILQLKMEESCRLLADPAIPISGVAQLLGYEDPAYFNRVFKKYTGSSPGRYRAEHLAPRG